MKIVGMTIENYRNIEFVDLKLDTKLNIVSGKNGAGKTSLIEAMIDAIEGKGELGKCPERKIKKGKDKAVIELEIDGTDGKLNIKRTITPKGVYLKATKEDGSDIKQSDLSTIMDKTTINLMKLLNLSPTEQIDFVKRIGGIDTSEIEALYKEKFEERTVLNRELKKTKAVAEETPPIIEQVEVPDIQKMQARISEAGGHNRYVLQQEQACIEADRITSAAESAVELFTLDVEAAKKKIEAARDVLAVKKQLLANAKKESTIRKKDASEKKALIEEPIDVSEILAKIEEAEKLQQINMAYDHYQGLLGNVQDKQEEVDQINSEMKALLEKREALINGSRLPFKNVSFDKETGLLINSIPFSEMSTAQKIKIMAKLYIASNPELKVIYIQDGSLLDPDTLREMTEMSELKDFQFLVELVGEQQNSIVMREGRIAGDNTEDYREEL